MGCLMIFMILDRKVETAVSKSFLGCYGTCTRANGRALGCNYPGTDVATTAITASSRFRVPNPSSFARFDIVYRSYQADEYRSYSRYMHCVGDTSKRISADLHPLWWQHTTSFPPFVFITGRTMRVAVAFRHKMSSISLINDPDVIWHHGNTVSISNYAAFFFSRKAQCYFLDPSFLV